VRLYVDSSALLKRVFDEAESRALTEVVDEPVEVALSGMLEKPITAEVIALARRLSPPMLRGLDAIHLASALLVDADALVSYDQRLNDAAGATSVRVLTPTR